MRTATANDLDDRRSAAAAAKAALLSAYRARMDAAEPTRLARQKERVAVAAAREKRREERDQIRAEARERQQAEERVHAEAAAHQAWLARSCIFGLLREHVENKRLIDGQS